MKSFLEDPQVLKWQEDMLLVGSEVLSVLACWWGIFVVFSLFFSCLKLEWRKWSCSSWFCSRPEQQSHFCGVTKKNPLIGGFCFRHCTIMTDLSCFCLGKLMLPLGTVLGGCVRWGALLCGQQCWFRSMLNAINPGVSCASFQPQSLCSHSEAAKCWLYEYDRDTWAKSHTQSPCQRFLSEKTLLIH